MGGSKRWVEEKRYLLLPGTKNSAVLTGCKNISEVKRLDENHLLALDWGLKLYVPQIPDDVEYVGIRMHDIRDGDGENHFKYYDFIEWASEEEFNEGIEMLKALSVYDTGVAVTMQDKLITLSTCEYSQENGRMALIAKRITD